MAVGSLSLFLLFAGSLTVVIGTCPNGYVQFQSYCLLFTPKTHSWQDAELDCRNHQAYLASDSSEDKHNFLEMYLNIFSAWRINKLWIGGSDFAIEGQWRWVETGVGITGFKAWGTGQPNGNGTNNCMALSLNANNEMVWTDERCSHSYNYVCEVRATGPVATTPAIIG